MVEFSPATREARVRFPDVAVLLYKVLCFTDVYVKESDRDYFDQANSFPAKLERFQRRHFV